MLGLRQILYFMTSIASRWLTPEKNNELSNELSDPMTRSLVLLFTRLTWYEITMRNAPVICPCHHEYMSH